MPDEHQLSSHELCDLLLDTASPKIWAEMNAALAAIARRHGLITTNADNADSVKWPTLPPPTTVSELREHLRTHHDTDTNTSNLDELRGSHAEYHHNAIKLPWVSPYAHTHDEPTSGPAPARLPGLSDIDWSGPATDIRDELVEIWFARNQWKDRDSETLADAERWADEMFEQNAKPQPEEN